MGWESKAKPRFSCFKYARYPRYVTNLDERYGRKTRRNRFVPILGSSLVVLFLGWSVWVNFIANDRVTATLTWVTQGEGEITAHVTVDRPNTTCSFKAMNAGYAIVGYKTVRSANTEYDLSINTVETALDILVDVCSAE